jgi:ACT domain-containing protein
MNKMKAFITVIGKDKVGIIHGVTSVLLKSNVNVLDIIQTRLENYFTMIMLADLTEMNMEFGELKQTLTAAGKELGVDIKIQHEDIFNSMHKI